MDKSVYFIILEAGPVFQKGKRSEGFWKPGEKRMLNEELLFGKKLAGLEGKEL